MGSYFLKKANGKSFNLKESFLNFFWLFAIVFLAHKLYVFLTAFLISEKSNNSCSLYYYLVRDSSFLYLIIFIVMIVFFTLYFKKLRWNNFNIRLRIICYTCILLLSWNYILYDYNYFLNHWDLFDRILLFISLVLAIYNPVFLILIIIQALVISQQFQYPSFFDYSYTDKSIVITIAIIAWLYIVVKTSIYKALPEVFVFVLILGTICHWYWMAGLGKLEINWLEKNELYKLFLVTVDYNWLYFLEWQSKLYIAEFLKKHNDVISFVTIVIELLFPLIILINKRVFIFVLISFMFFHFSVFFSSGIFFWKWIVLEIVILFCYLNYNELWLSKNRIDILLLYFVFLFSATFYSSTIKLSWFDSGIYNKYEFKVKNCHGEIFNVEPSFFSPYDLSFAQNRFDFINDDKIRTSTFGSTLDENVLSLRNETAIFEYVNLNGKYKFDNNKKENLIGFIKTFVNNKQKCIQLDLPNAPSHIWQGKDMSNEIFKHKLDSIFIIKKFRYVNDRMEYQDLDVDVVKVSLN